MKCACTHWGGRANRVAFKPPFKHVTSLMRAHVLQFESAEPYSMLSNSSTTNTPIQAEVLHAILRGLRCTTKPYLEWAVDKVVNGVKSVGAGECDAPASKKFACLPATKKCSFTSLTRSGPTTQTPKLVSTGRGNIRDERKHVVIHIPCFLRQKDEVEQDKEDTDRTSTNSVAGNVSATAPMDSVELVC